MSQEDLETSQIKGIEKHTSVKNRKVECVKTARTTWEPIIPTQ